ncbi:hypothetical protein SRHO_G00227370 [Serrasalmus rhombeus]
MHLFLNSLFCVRSTQSVQWRTVLELKCAVTEQHWSEQSGGVRRQAEGRRFLCSALLWECSCSLTGRTALLLGLPAAGAEGDSSSRRGEMQTARARLARSLTRC